MPLETRNANSYLLAFDNTGNLTTGFAISNPSTQAAEVFVTIRDDTGAQIGTGQIPLAARGHDSFMLTDPAEGFPINGGKRGTVEFETPSGGRISVIGLRVNNGKAITTLPLLADVGTGGGALAHVAAGGGWQTTFTLVNTGSSSTQAQLKFLDENGVALPLLVKYPQAGRSETASIVTATLAGGASLVLQAQGFGGQTASTGSAQLTSSGQVSGFAIFQCLPTAQEAVVPLETRNNGSYILAFDNSNGKAKLDFAIRHNIEQIEPAGHGHVAAQANNFASGHSCLIGSSNNTPYLNDAAFQLAQSLPNQLQIGDVSWTTPGLVGHTFSQWDFSPMKNFNFGKSNSRYLRLRFEAENLFNHMNAGNRDTQITDSNFGMISGQNGTPRVAMVAAKLHF